MAASALPIVLALALAAVAVAALTWVNRNLRGRNRALEERVEAFADQE